MPLLYIFTLWQNYEYFKTMKQIESTHPPHLPRPKPPNCCQNFTSFCYSPSWFFRALTLNFIYPFLPFCDFYRTFLHTNASITKDFNCKILVLDPTWLSPGDTTGRQRVTVGVLPAHHWSICSQSNPSCLGNTNHRRPCDSLISGAEKASLHCLHQNPHLLLK